MAKLIWLTLLANCVLVALCDDPTPVPRIPPKGPLLINFSIEKVTDEKPTALPMVKLEKSQEASSNLIENLVANENEDAKLLNPLEPIFPSFADNFFKRLPFLRPVENIQNTDAAAAADNNQQPKRGILTIILVKSHNKNSDSSDLEKPVDLTQFKDNILNTAEQKFKSLRDFLMQDLFAKPTNGAEDDFKKEKVHLLGGPTDPDNFFNFQRDESNESSDELLGDESNEDDQSNRLKTYLRLENNSPMISDDIGYMQADSNEPSRQHGCNLMRFMKLKASVYYNTIIHLLFISGIILIILLMTVLTIRVHRRRRALRFYNKNNMNVASIDSALTKKKEAESGGDRRFFRLGNLKTSYEQRFAPSALLNAPPSYDQVNTSENSKLGKSSMVKSLAADIKYERVPSAQQADVEERRSVSSLPAYDEKMNSSK